VPTVLRYFSSLVLMAILSNACHATPPLNMTCAKNSIIAYYENGNYLKDVKNVVNDAEKYLQKRIRQNNLHNRPEKLAMILDIDETSLSNFPAIKNRDFSESPSLIDASFRKANAPAITPVLNLYNEAIKAGVSVFFVTFRPDIYTTYTISNLQKSGFYGWTGIYLPNPDQVKLPAQQFKTAVRENITGQGYRIILNLGDQDSDLEGGYAEHTDKLPNPLYTAPTKCTATFCRDRL
jgi:predicted secreted acid phosphatase